MGTGSLVDWCCVPAVRNWRNEKCECRRLSTKGVLVMHMQKGTGAGRLCAMLLHWHVLPTHSADPLRACSEGGRVSCTSAEPPPLPRCLRAFSQSLPSLTTDTATMQASTAV